MEQNIGRANGRESKIPFPPAESYHKSHIARACAPKSQQDWNNERMEYEASTKERPANDATSEYWHSMLGQKVCIGGVKRGILRYYGKTEFANGIWCGVELDEPVGKNDGTVDGVTYFNCEQNYGIFAPVSKVEKMSLEKTAEISNIKSKLPAPKINAKTLISRISGARHVQSSEDILFEKQDESRMSNFQCYGKRTKISSSTSDDSNINRLNVTGVTTENLFDMEDFNEITSDESPEHLAKRSRLSTETKSKTFDSTFNLQESFSKQSVSSASLKDTKNGINMNSTFNISSPVLTDNDNDCMSNDRDHFDKSLSFSDLLCKNDGTFVVEATSSLLEKYSSFEDDQISLDLDESLGILTPNQMKDFTICLDTQNSEVIDLETLNIPNSESCDDINEIPEYEEIQGITVEYKPERNSGSVQVSLLKHSSSEDCTLVTSLEECMKTPKVKLHKYVDSSPSKLLDRGMEKLMMGITSCCESEPYKESLFLDHSSSNTELNSKHQKSIKSSFIPTENNNIISDELTSENQTESHVSLEKIVPDIKKHCLNEMYCDITLKGEIDGESYLELNNVSHQAGDLKDNRPISMHTLESTDTGYQEDVGFDNRSEQEDICEDINRFSIGSRESCTVMDEIEIKNENHHTVTDSGIVLSGEGDEIFRPNEMEVHASLNSVAKIESSTLLLQEELALEQKQNNVKKVDVTEFNKLERWPMEASDESCHMFEKAISSCQEIEQKQNSCTDAKIDVENELAITYSNEIAVDNAITTNGNYCCTISSTSPSNLVSEKSDCALPAKSEQETPKKEKMHKTQEKVIDVSNNKNHTKAPKKNVISKIKAMIEATTSKAKVKADNVEQAKKPNFRKGRWDAVTSKIAAGLAEEKSKPKAKKEIKSRIDTNLSGSRQISTKRNLGADFTKGNSSFGNDNGSESSLTMKNTFDHQRSADLSIDDTIGSVGKDSADGSQAKDRRQIVNTATASRLQKNNNRTLSPLIGISQRPASPVPPSDSSSVSNTSKRVTVKQNFQGSNSTLASASSNNAKKPNVSSTVRKATSGTMPPQKRVPSKTKPKISQPSFGHGKYGGSAQTPTPPVWSTRVELAQEIQRLGTLCEARTKELNHMKMNFRQASLGFDAFVVLFQYLTEELDAFSQPRLMLELERTHAALEEAEAHLQQYQKEFDELKAKHSQELCELERELNQSHQETIENLTLNHTAEIEELRQSHDKQLAELTESQLKQCQEVEEKHSIALLDLKNEHCQQIEELKMFHADQIEAIENSHHETRMELNSQLKELEQQCKDLKHQAKLVEEALQRDTDTKIQWISAKKADLEKEVDSLKTVLDMRRTEIHSLRKENLEMKKELEKLPVAKEKIKMLEAKAEDLQALVNQKIQVERQLSSDHQHLKENYEKESKVNTRLSMENEELMWKLKQNAEANLILSSSFSGSSEAIEKSLSPLKSPSKQSVSLPMFFHSIENDIANAEKNSVSASSTAVTPCKKQFISARKCSSPVRTPSFVAASPPGPCSRRCKVDLKVAVSPRKQSYKSHSSEKKLSSRDASSVSGHASAETAPLKVKAGLQQQSTPIRKGGGTVSQAKYLDEIHYNEELVSMLDESNGSSDDGLCSREMENSDTLLNFEHYNMLITNEMLSRKYRELTHLEKSEEFTHTFEEPINSSLISNTNNDCITSEKFSNVAENACHNSSSSRDFTFNNQHFMENEQKECPFFPHQFDYSFLQKKDDSTISPLCENAGDLVVSNSTNTICETLPSHQPSGSSSVSVDVSSQVSLTSSDTNCIHPFQSSLLQERNSVVPDSKNSNIIGKDLLLDQS